MKIRIKYSKLGNLKFIGHLDVMRYFQKEIRRAKLDISYSKGYSPHQIISFAAPLALGITSDGEYFDAEFNSVTTSAEMIEALNAVSVDEIHVTKCVQIPENAKNAMSIVAASDYEITFREQNDLSEKLLASVEELNKQDEIIVLKKTKKSEKEENIRPGILKLERRPHRSGHASAPPPGIHAGRHRQPVRLFRSELPLPRLQKRDRPLPRAVAGHGRSGSAPPLARRKQTGAGALYLMYRGCSAPLFYALPAFRFSRKTVSASVMASETGNAAQTPFIPNSALSTSEQTTMATMPRHSEVMEASAGRLTAPR